MNRQLALAVALLTVACGSTSTAQVAATPLRSPSAQVTASAAPTAGTGSSSPSASASPSPGPTVACRNGSAGSSIVMIGGYFGSAHLIYDVTDPLHPTLMCTITGTAAHLFTGDTFVYLKQVSASETDVILHSFGSGNESKAASFPRALTDTGLNGITDEAWTPDGGLLAYTITDENAGTVQVWVYSQGNSRLVHTYGQPIGDCPCRFGLPPQMLAFSPDGQYLVAGWVAGKGSTPLTVIRVADGANVLTADPGEYSALWDRTGHRLFLIGRGTYSWSPEAGIDAQSNATWSFMPGISPDGTEAAFTAYEDPNTQVQPRVYLYYISSGIARFLVDQLRTQVLFVKDGWVWYLEERACPSAGTCPGTTVPTGRVFAMQLSTGVEQPVTFASGEDPLTSGWSSFTPGEYWPNS